MESNKKACIETEKWDYTDQCRQSRTVTIGVGFMKRLYLGASIAWA